MLKDIWKKHFRKLIKFHKSIEMLFFSIDEEYIVNLNEEIGVGVIATTSSNYADLIYTRYVGTLPTLPDINLLQ